MGDLGAKLNALAQQVGRHGLGKCWAESGLRGSHSPARVVEFSRGRDSLFLYLGGKDRGDRLVGLRYIQAGCRGETDGICHDFEEGDAYTVSTGASPDGKVSHGDVMLLEHDNVYRFDCDGDACTVENQCGSELAAHEKRVPDGLKMKRVNGFWKYGGPERRQGVGRQTAGKMNHVERRIESVVDAALRCMGLRDERP